MGPLIDNLTEVQALRASGAVGIGLDVEGPVSLSGVVVGDVDVVDGAQLQFGGGRLQRCPRMMLLNLMLVDIRYRTLRDIFWLFYN